MIPIQTPPPIPPKTPLPPVFPHSWACAYGEDEFGLWQAFEVKGVRQILRWIPPGDFLMGSPETESERHSNETLHHVFFDHGFWMADTACTQELWEAVANNNPSRLQGNKNLPVEQVSWIDVNEEFLPKLNSLIDGLEATLPSEKQWEYACRSGTQTPFWFGKQITTDQVNFDGRLPYAGGEKGLYRGETVATKTLPANGWGLYEMHGNVFEWCEDVMSNYSNAVTLSSTSNHDVNTEHRKVLRGGSSSYHAKFCRSAYRSTREPDARNVSIGFRVVRGAS